MKIFSWKINNLKKIIESQSFTNILDLFEYKYDIICLQEDKKYYYEYKLIDKLKEKYTFNYNTESKDNVYKLSIYSIFKPLNIIENLDIELNNRVLSLEYDNFILINIIVPYSGYKMSEDYIIREKWNFNFFNYIKSIKDKYINKEIIICGDMNVAHGDIDVTFPKEKQNKIAGFYDIERSDFAYLLEMSDLVDVYRKINPLKKKSTYWNQGENIKRKHENGWRLDYFLTSEKIFNQIVKQDFLIDIKGSKRCPITLELKL